MERSTRALEIAEALHEELDASAEHLNNFQVGAVVRVAAEAAVEEATEERIALIAYLQNYCGSNPRVMIALEQCAIGAHRRRKSQAIEAVVERSRR